MQKEQEKIDASREKARSNAMSSELKWLKRRVECWEKEDDERRWRAKKAKIEEERRMQMEAEIKSRVRTEEQERERVHVEIMQNKKFNRK